MPFAAVFAPAIEAFGAPVAFLRTPDAKPPLRSKRKPVQHHESPLASSPPTRRHCVPTRGGSSAQPWSLAATADIPRLTIAIFVLPGQASLVEN